MGPRESQDQLEETRGSFLGCRACIIRSIRDFSEDEETEGEQCYVAIGRDARGHILVVVYTYRGENIRLISARPATRKERREYESGI